MACSLSMGEVQTFLKLNSRPQHPLSGRDVTLVTEREGWGLTRRESSIMYYSNPPASVKLSTASLTAATSLTMEVKKAVGAKPRPLQDI